MIDFKEIFEKVVKEDAVVAAGAAGGGEVVAADGAGDSDIAPEKGISADDVLGKCDHHKDGYLGAKCFHVPKNGLGKGHMMKRFELPYGTNKKKKKLKDLNPYMKGMVMTEDFKSEVIILQRCSEDSLYNLIVNYYGLDAEVLGDIIAVVKLLGTDKFFVKFMSDFKGQQMKEYYIETKMKDGRLVHSDNRKVMNADEAKKMFEEQAKKAGLKNSEDIQCCVMWGRV